jgi:hypothetical protein
MIDSILYPRLPLRAARQRYIEIADKSSQSLGDMVSYGHPEATYAATGGSRVSGEVLTELRVAMLELAKRYGFPAAARREALLSFEPEAGALLHATMPIQPGEACRDEVWSFLTLIMLPDMAAWRFAERNEARFIGGARNVFQRLWWRAHVLEDPEHADRWWLLRLPEDALVGLMERPGISSNRTVSRLIAREISRIAALPTNIREDAWRDAYKRIRQRFPLVNLEALPEVDCAAQIAEICRGTVIEFQHRLTA